MFICVSLKLELGWVKVGRGAKLKKDPEVHRMMHRTLSRCVRCVEFARQHSPDAGTVSLQQPVRCVRWSARPTRGHQTLSPASGGHRPVVRSFAELSALKTGGHRARPVPHKERPMTPNQAHLTRTRGVLRVVSFLQIVRSRDRALTKSP